MAIAGLLHRVYCKESQRVDGKLVNVAVSHAPLLECEMFLALNPNF
jgi:hypothetical protein